jgi:hypothetical protein
LPILRVTQLLVILVWVVTLEALSLAEWPLVRWALAYVIVGPTERARYGASVHTRFAGWLQPACHRAETTVDRVPDSTRARLSSMGN